MRVADLAKAAKRMNAHPCVTVSRVVATRVSTRRDIRAQGGSHETQCDVLCAHLWLVWGIGLFCVTWRLIAFDDPTGEVTFIGRVYRGDAIILGGSLVGLI